MAAESPCTGVCKLDSAGRNCLGCHRTIDEIAHWGQGSDSWKDEVIARLSARAINAR